MTIYTNEEVYKITLVALKHPGTYYNSTLFWTKMTQKYGIDFFSGREGTSLRSKWRKIAGEHGNDLREYNKTLERTLDRKVVRKIKKEVGECDEGDSGSDEKQEGEAPERPPKRKRPAQSRNGGNGDTSAESQLEPLPQLKCLVEGEEEEKDWRTGRVAFNLTRLVDLQPLQLLTKRSNLLSKWREHRSQSGQDELAVRYAEEARYFVVLKRGKAMALVDVRKLEGINDAQTDLIGHLKKLASEHNLRLEEVYMLFGQASGNMARLIAHLNGEQPVMWNQLDDLALQHVDDKKILLCLSEHKGEGEIDKRQAYLRQFKFYLT